MLRDFSYVAPEIPEYIPDNCTGCMDCVTECPDTAILGKVMGESELEEKLSKLDDKDREMFDPQWSKTRKYYDSYQKKLGKEGGRFAIIIDPSKCKGCAECVTVCDDLALKMIPKSEEKMEEIQRSHRLFKEFGPSDERFINDNLLIDMMLKEQTHIYVGGAGSVAPVAAKGPPCGCCAPPPEPNTWRPVGHRRGDRLQHGLHIDLSVQSVPRPLDELAV